MFNLNRTPLAMPGFPSRKSHGLDLVHTGRKSPRGPIMTHAPKGKTWKGPGVTGSVRRRKARLAMAEMS